MNAQANSDLQSALSDPCAEYHHAKYPASEHTEPAPDNVLYSAILVKNSSPGSVIFLRYADISSANQSHW
jgi:hypothetical protein